MRVLVLDDDDNRHNRFREWLIGTNAVHVHTAKDAIDQLTQGERFDLVCLDHDLDLCTDRIDTGCGAEVSWYIAHHLDWEKIPRAILIHSHNDVAAVEMQNDLRYLDTFLVRSEFGNATGMVLAAIWNALKRLTTRTP